MLKYIATSWTTFPQEESEIGFNSKSPTLYLVFHVQVCLFEALNAFQQSFNVLHSEESIPVLFLDAIENFHLQEIHEDCQETMFSVDS